MPVHNVASELQGRTQRVLEILPDLAEDFELHIIDDGSSDATLEVADELAREYPQIQVTHNAHQLGTKRAVQQAVARLGRQVVIVDNEQALPTSADFSRIG